MENVRTMYLLELTGMDNGGKQAAVIPGDSTSYVKKGIDKIKGQSYVNENCTQ